MKLNKKYFLAIFTALGTQAVFGINFANAICDEEAETYCTEIIRQESTLPSGAVREHKGNFSTCISDMSAEAAEFESYTEEYNKTRDPKIIAGVKRLSEYYEKEVSDHPKTKLYKYFLYQYKKNLCLQKNRLSRLTNNDKNSTNQSSSSSLSNQTASTAPSNSEASQNKQSYQAAQIAHNQANAGRGKKHNSKADASDCMKPNADQTHYKNACNYPINFSYCFLGVVQGAKDVDTQLLKDLSCQNKQFSMTELSAGEDLAGNYLGLTIGGIACKSPSQPLDMEFESVEDGPTGRCSF